MTEGEKMVWAAAFAGKMEGDFGDAETAASHAKGVVMAIRIAVSVEKLSADSSPARDRHPWFMMANEMVSESESVAVGIPLPEYTHPSRCEKCRILFARAEGEVNLCGVCQ
jgi:hypothetical protein